MTRGAPHRGMPALARTAKSLRMRAAGPARRLPMASRILAAAMTDLLPPAPGFARLRSRDRR